MRVGWRRQAGIAHSKSLAKLGSGLHKPNQQTILPTRAASIMLRDLPLGRIRGLGGDVIGGALQSEFKVYVCHVRCSCRRPLLTSPMDLLLVIYCM